MVKKQTVRYVCSNCGAIQSSWSGRCSQCEEWNTLQEEAVLAPVVAGKVSAGRQLQVSSVTTSVAKDQPRISAGIPDVNVVLGGGIVPGSVNLIAGQPGIGKSTLLLQVAYAASADVSVLYVSGEESAYQVGLRAERLGAQRKQLQLATSTSADDVAATLRDSDFKLVIVDSIQTMSTDAVASAAGTVSQITNCTNLITAAAKQSNTAVLLVGHVTKEGAIAGPKVMEHMVDVVLQLDGDQYGGFKILRASKNRYGATTEAAIFEMNDKGLQIVENPSAALLAERQITDGSVVLATLEGTRPLLVEVQALVNKTSYGYPKRAASGIELNRLNLLVAMLERRTKLNLSDQDIYINIVGGIRVSEPAADLAICMAIASAAKGMKLNDNAVVFGEVGLSGEVRHAPHADKRLAEAKKLGYTMAIGPKLRQGKAPAGLNPVSTVRDALNQFLSKD